MIGQIYRKYSIGRSRRVFLLEEKTGILCICKNIAKQSSPANGGLFFWGIVPLI